MPAIDQPPLLWIPHNYNALEVLPPDLHRYAECSNYLLSILNWLAIRRHQETDTYTPLHAATLAKIIPAEKVKPLIVSMVNGGAIETDGSYVRGKKSIGYRLAPKYRVIHRPVPITNERLATKIGKQKQENRESYLPIHHYLEEQQQRIRLDSSQARQILATSPATNHTHQYVVDCLEAEDWRFNLDEQGRIHTNVSSFPKIIRPALRVDGQSLCNLDIRNSQPLLLAVPILINALERVGKGDGWMGRWMAGKVDNESLTLNPLYTQPNPHPTYDFGFKPYDFDRGLLRFNADLFPDEREYVSLCEHGNFYSYMRSCCPTFDDLPYDQFKERVFTSIFFDKVRKTPGPLLRTFQARFPHVWELIVSMKGLDYRRFSRLLQRTESLLIIEGVCETIRQQRPGMFIQTIHDSVLIEKGNAEYVESVIKQTYRQWGLFPKVKHEIY